MDLRLNEKLAEVATNVDEAYARMPGGAPGAATRNYHFLPEESTSYVKLVSVEGASCADAELLVSNARLGSHSPQSARSFNVNLAHGRFSMEWKVFCSSTEIGTVPEDPTRTLPPAVFTANWANFQMRWTVEVPDTAISLMFEVQVKNSKW